MLLVFFTGIWYNILRGVGKLAVIINVSNLQINMDLDGAYFIFYSWNIM